MLDPVARKPGYVNDLCEFPLVALELLNKKLPGGTAIPVLTSLPGDFDAAAEGVRQGELLAGVGGCGEAGG